MQTKIKKFNLNKRKFKIKRDLEFRWLKTKNTYLCLCDYDDKQKDKQEY